MKKENLIKITKAMNDIIPLEPALPTNVGEKTLLKNLNEAVELIDPEIDELGDDIYTLLHKEGLYTNPKMEFEEKEETEESEEIDEEKEVEGTEETEEVKEKPAKKELTLLQLVKECGDMRELKELVKTDKRFKDFRGIMTKYKRSEELRKAMEEFAVSTEDVDGKEEILQAEAEKNAPKKGKKTEKKESVKAVKKVMNNVEQEIPDGSKVSFVSSIRAKVSPGKPLVGIVIGRNIDKRNNKEYIKIEVLGNYYYKVIKDIKLI